MILQLVDRACPVTFSELKKLSERDSEADATVDGHLGGIASKNASRSGAI